MASPANAVESAALAARFRALADQWKAAVAYSSSTTAILTDPHSRAIIALGLRVVPLILHDLEREPAHWFEAVRAITGQDPVPREEWGKIPAMRAAWLAWGRSHGLL